MQHFSVSIPWTDPLASYRELKPEIDAAISGVLDSGHYISGTRVEAFEQAWAKYCGAKYAIGVASGTDALRVALIACGISWGDEVITVSHTAVATVSAIVSVGAEPVMIDVDNSWTMNTAQIEPAVTKCTKAIIPVHLYGYPAEMDTIMRVAKKYGLWVIEDCAQAHGARYHSKPVGTIGHIGTFSHYPTKNLGAMGDAGSVITNDAQLAQKMRLIRQYGTPDNREAQIAGINARMDEVQAAVLSVKLPHLDRWNDRRYTIAKMYYKALCDKFEMRGANKQYAHHLYVVRTTRRDELAAHLRKRGIMTSVHYPVPVHLQEPFRGNGFLPMTERLCQEILTLPLYPQMTNEEVGRVIDACLDF